ncbi:MAG: GyrI-like domain-containing protein [Streptococcaceae bacterium]|nr:GyrI-like domain-containing protein [Streptococcaceae bacterium]MCL2681590.1 GyrI-like domain-containing protein [Streptococcaceae bacterium]MCL2858204.1 GyrI-like domain-containing protein [Streptococcaceae bacterium]
MSKYTIEHKNAFTLAGLGFSFQSSFDDFQGIAKEKGEFYSSIENDGSLPTLRDSAKNNLLWSVNEVYQGKPWNYLAVEPAKTIEKVTRMVEFPDSEYVIVSGTADDSQTLFDSIAGKAFGQVLDQINDYAYVGGPNGTFSQVKEDGSYYGEIWIPVIAK